MNVGSDFQKDLELLRLLKKGKENDILRVEDLVIQKERKICRPGSHVAIEPNGFNYSRIWFTKS